VGGGVTHRCDGGVQASQCVREVLGAKGGAVLGAEAPLRRVQRARLQRLRRCRRRQPPGLASAHARQCRRATIQRDLAVSCPWTSVEAPRRPLTAAGRRRQGQRAHRGKVSLGKNRRCIGTSQSKRAGRHADRCGAARAAPPHVSQAQAHHQRWVRRGERHRDVASEAEPHQQRPRRPSGHADLHAVSGTDNARPTRAGQPVSQSSVSQSALHAPDPTRGQRPSSRRRA
jgi:hypothetical protein